MQFEISLLRISQRAYDKMQFNIIYPRSFITSLLVVKIPIFHKFNSAAMRPLWRCAGI